MIRKTFNKFISTAVVLMTSTMLIVPSITAEKTSSVEPYLAIKKDIDPPRIALTFDLCMGKTDRRIFDILIAEKIPATLFVTARWLVKNPDAIAQIKAHPELFEIGNHGQNHIPAIDEPGTIYGLKTAGNLRAVCEEVEGGAQAIEKSGLTSQFKPFYRGAAARYTTRSLKLIEDLGFHVAGFSINGDQGASLSASMVLRRLKTAKDGDVTIAHMNQPTRASGAGVAEALHDLKKQSMHFVTLSQGLGVNQGAPALQSCAEFFKGAQ